MSFLHTLFERASKMAAARSDYKNRIRRLSRMTAIPESELSEYVQDAAKNTVHSIDEVLAIMERDAIKLKP